MRPGRRLVHAVIGTTMAAVAVLGCAANVGADTNRATTNPRQTPANHDVAPSRHHSAAPAVAPVRRGKSLAGKTVGIDPGHNGGNASHPKYDNHKIWNGREYENCNTAGTSTNSGYPEYRFTWRVSTFLRRDLRHEGAHVVMTHPNDHGVGPCVNRRAHIINRAHADVGIDIHGD